MLYPSAPNYSFKYQKIWLSAVMKEGLLIPAYFSKNSSYKCKCVDNTYGNPDPTCKICFGTGYTNRQEIENRKLIAVLSAPLDKETIDKYSLGNFTKSSRILLLSYPVSPEFTRLYDIKSTINLIDSDGSTVNAMLGYIVQPQDKEAKIIYKEKLYDTNTWVVKEIEFHIIAVESYKVSEFPIGQKLILQQTSVESSNKRFIPDLVGD